MRRRYNQNEPLCYAYLRYHAGIVLMLTCGSPIQSCFHALMWPLRTIRPTKDIYYEKKVRNCHRAFSAFKLQLAILLHPSKVSLPKQNESLECGNSLANGGSHLGAINYLLDSKEHCKNTALDLQATLQGREQMLLDRAFRNELEDLNLSVF